MPVVPIRPRSAKRPGAAVRPLPKVSPTFLAMAAAQMMSDRQALASAETDSDSGSTAAMRSTLPAKN